jgi:hypothetical protein
MIIRATILAHVVGIAFLALPAYALIQPPTTTNVFD